MSLDYPYYEELRRRKHPAAIWWRIGDTLYYLGLLSAILSICATVAALFVAILSLDSGWRSLWAAPIAFVASGMILVIGHLAKGHAYTLGERDGISAKEVYEHRQDKVAP